jgi:hypothetical protein
VIVFEGQSDRELCAEYEISQARYYQPRQLCLVNAPSRQGRLERETCGSRPWSASSPRSSKKLGDPEGEALRLRHVVAHHAVLLECTRHPPAEHSSWGCRPDWAYLCYVDGLAVKKKRVYGILKASGRLANQAPNSEARPTPGSAADPGPTNAGAST